MTNVIDGGFGKNKQEEDDTATVAEVFEVMAEEFMGVEGAKCLVIVHMDGSPIVCAGNTDLNDAALLLIQGQYALTRYSLHGSDYDDEETLH